jgi:hypothetical protein
MSAEDAFWFETLMDGTLPIQPGKVTDVGVCVKDDLFACYVTHARLRGISHRAIETKLGMFLRKQLGEELKEIRPRVASLRYRCYAFPPLIECRKRFVENLGQPVDWLSEDWESEEWQHDIDWYDNLKKKG